VGMVHHRSNRDAGMGIRDDLSRFFRGLAFQGASFESGEGSPTPSNRLVRDAFTGRSTASLTPCAPREIRFGFVLPNLVVRP
jgi:hypothetical protein